MSIGYAPDRATGRIEIVTGSGTEYCPEVPAETVSAWG